MSSYDSSLDAEWEPEMASYRPASPYADMPEEAIQALIQETRGFWNVEDLPFQGNVPTGNTQPNSNP